MELQQFHCERCHEDFLSPITEEEALNNAVKEYGKVDFVIRLVCAECYHIIKAEGYGN